MQRPTSHLYVSIAAFDVATRRTRSAGCKRRNALVKVNRSLGLCGCERSRSFLIQLPIGFESDLRFESDLSRSDSIQIQYSNRFEP